ncbi:MAG: metallophosphoesterase family protein [Candidatus Bathyarchaeia archaeon]
MDYNPWPSESIDLVRELSIRTVMGNHDRDSARGTPIGYNLYAEQSCLWTHRKLTLEEKIYLMRLPEMLTYTIDGVKLFICHGSPKLLVDEYVFPPPTTPEGYLQELTAQTGVDVLILGHTHVPFIYHAQGRYVINPGGVGQPRDGDPRASYVMMEVEGTKVRFEHRRVIYDIDKVAKAIIKAGLPKVLARRLYLGL